MKKCTKKSYAKIAVGILFLVAGIMKLFVMGPGAFAGMLSGLLGLSSGLALVAAWLVALVELVGGAAILAACKFPCKKTYKILVSLLIAIIVVAILSVDIFGANFDAMSLLKHLVILGVLIDICPCLKACAGGKCHSEKKECSDCKAGTCTTCKA